jgi:HTH-type transcriptional regulator/antitoxin HipB
MDYPIQTPQQLAQVLRGFRKRRRLTQTEAGNKAGLLPKTISSLEANAQRTSVESLFRLLSALKIEFVLREKEEAPIQSSRSNW